MSRSTVNKLKDHIAKLEGRDLIWFLIDDCFNCEPANPEFKYLLQNVDGDNITAFWPTMLVTLRLRNFWRSV